MGTQFTIYGNLTARRAEHKKIMKNLKLNVYFLHFQDLLNFDDPLNNEAAEQYLKDKKAFQSKVREYIAKYARR